MRIRDSIHEHFLYFYDFIHPAVGFTCAKCTQVIDASAFGCEACKFWLHSSCASFPDEIADHPLHLEHPLKLSQSICVCNNCSYLFDYAPYYTCRECNVMFDFGCVFPDDSDDHPSKIESRTETEKGKKILHFSHDGDLYLCKGRKFVRNNCSWCNHPILLDGWCYACPFCRFILHESCVDRIPNELQENPFHSSHPLRMKFHLNWNTKCNACKNSISICLPRCFCCEVCNFFLHIGCANFLKPNLKHNCHDHKLAYFHKKDHLQHNLSYFLRDIYNESFPCKSCGVDCGFNGFYRCVQCDINFHLDCVPIPRIAQHPYHSHPLTLMESYIEGCYDEYYCDVCGEERDPTHHVYCCPPCLFAAHIECVVSEDKTSTEPEQLPKLKGYVGAERGTQEKEAEFPSLVELNKAVADVDNSQQIQIPDFIHKHPMRLVEIGDKDGNPRCNGCLEELCGSAYACESCQYYLHKSCAELPREKQHPFHSKHSFRLITSPPFNTIYFICNACKCISAGFYYFCEYCRLTLDLKCAALVPPSSDEGEQDKKMERKITGFLHSHEVELGNCDQAHGFECARCQLQIVGPVYCCFSCNYFLHESCTKLPLTIQQHPCHLQHNLVAERTIYKEPCYGCNLAMDGIKYFCGECKLNLHHICADSLTRPLKHDSHKDHGLYYFGRDVVRYFQKYGSRIHEIDTPKFECNLCGELCEKPFYRCVECRVNMHLECMQIPQTVKSAWHMHSLTLIPSLLEEEDPEGYYCDICGEIGNPKNHVYCCEECPHRGLFVAHIDCALSTVEETAATKKGSADSES